jgi:MarR family transcriptional regulator, organic hydroperoxide resistance regulator
MLESRQYRFLNFRERLLSKQNEVDSSIAELRVWQQVLPNDRMAHMIKDASRALNRELQNRLAQHNVLLGHWVYLRVLWEQDGLTKRDLSVAASTSEPTTLMALRAMDALGYVKMQKRPENKKNIYVFLTTQGKKLKTSLVPVAEEINTAAFKGVSSTDRKVLRNAFTKVLANLG